MLHIYFTVVSVLLRLTWAQLDRSGWTATADSFQPGNEPSKAIDGNINTFWHTQFNPSVKPYPHNIVIDMKTLYWVNKVSYQPRQDGSNNGNIGQHRIELSQDGTNWGTPLGIGTYADTNNIKTTTVQTTHARYLRMTAITEAGGRGGWASCAEINVFAVSGPGPGPTGKGEWSPTIDFPVVPASAAMLHDTGRILVWASNRAETFGGKTTGLTYTATYDPKTQVVSQRIVTNTMHDMFCPGLSVDATGRPIVTGGDDAFKTTIYDPTPDTWIGGPNMKISRGYQSQCTISDGRTFVIGGSWSGGTGGKNGEIYSPASNSWTLLPGCPVAPMLTNDKQGVYRADNHAWLFAWKGGSVFQAGPSKAMNWYGTAGTGSRAAGGNRAADGDAMCGNAVMYDAVAGKILTVGGAPNYQGDTATSNAHVITINNPNTPATVVKIASMAYQRAFHNSVVLPDGKVIVVGGQSFAMPFSDATSALYPELWNPATQGWTTLNPIAVPRNYHSVALLMPDATVLSGGGGLCGTCNTNHFDGQVFTPPYLFNAAGARAARPAITAISGGVYVVGNTFTITTSVACNAFSLIRVSSTTHTVNTDQRRIPLTPTATNGLTYSLKIPADPGIAVPGYWMVFALTGGVPSISRTILIKRA